jgi:hypothetical protein
MRMEQLSEAEELKVMIESDRGHLLTAIARGDRAIAHDLLDAVINNQRRLEDIIPDACPICGNPGRVTHRCRLPQTS